jgi:hypothetical protein
MIANWMTTGRIWVALVLLVMLMLPAADRLSLVIELDRPRTVRLVDIALLLLGAAAFLQVYVTQGLFVRRHNCSSLPPRCCC